MKTCSTKEAALRADVHFITIQRWVSDGKVSPSERIKQGRFTLWRWTDSDVEKVLEYKEKHYREGRGRKQRLKKKLIK
jgi:predicted site-specific integrase-resolvase